MAFEILQNGRRKFLMKVDISIIIPIYKGKHYIPYWLDVVEKNAAYLTELQLQCELILVNDCPEEKLETNNLNDRGFTLKTLNSYKNRGIHGARVYGLKHAAGEWIVFLDQDDKIADNYLVKQKVCIGDADGVICNGYIKYFCKDISNFIYTDIAAQEITRDLSYYLSIANPIPSPGQVMLKREAIPDVWRQHILKMNGADDYFLWILMLKGGKKFTLNADKLYTHIGHGNNVSNDISTIARSIDEMDTILEINNLLDDEEKKTLKKRKVWGLDRPRSAEIIEIYDYWLYLEHRKLQIADYLCMNNYYKIGIYGMSSLGNRLYDLLANSDAEAVFAMDKRAEEFVCKIPVFRLEDTSVENYMKQVDIIIVTVVSDFQSIKEEIRNRYGVMSLSLKNILMDMIEKTNSSHEGNEI